MAIIIQVIIHPAGAWRGIREVDPGSPQTGPAEDLEGRPGEKTGGVEQPPERSIPVVRSGCKGEAGIERPGLSCDPPGGLRGVGGIGSRDLGWPAGLLSGVLASGSPPRPVNAGVAVLPYSSDDGHTSCGILRNMDIANTGMMGCPIALFFSCRNYGLRCCGILRVMDIWQPVLPYSPVALFSYSSVAEHMDCSTSLLPCCGTLRNPGIIVAGITGFPIALFRSC